MMFTGNDATGWRSSSTSPGQNIIGIDDKGCSVSTFVDDKKTNLATKKEGFGGRPGWMGSFPQMAPDGSACAIDIVSDQRRRAAR